MDGRDHSSPCELSGHLSIASDVVGPWDLIDVHLGFLGIGNKLSNGQGHHRCTHRRDLEFGISETAHIGEAMLHAGGHPGAHIRPISLYLVDSLQGGVAVILNGGALGLAARV